MRNKPKKRADSEAADYIKRMRAITEDLKEEEKRLHLNVKKRVYVPEKRNVKAYEFRREKRREARTGDSAFYPGTGTVRNQSGKYDTGYPNPDMQNQEIRQQRKHAIKQESADKDGKTVVSFGIRILLSA